MANTSHSASFHEITRMICLVSPVIIIHASTAAHHHRMARCSTRAACRMRLEELCQMAIFLLPRSFVFCSTPPSRAKRLQQITSRIAFSTKRNLARPYPTQIMNCYHHHRCGWWYAPDGCGGCGCAGGGGK